MFLMIAFPLELVVQPHFYGKIIDGVSKSIPSKIMENNKHIIMILIGLWIVNQILYASLDILDSYVIPKVQSYVRTNLVNDIIYTFKNNYEELEIGSIISKVVKLPHTIRDIQHQIRNFFLPTIIILVVAVTYFYFINKTLGILGFIGLCLFVSILYFAGQSCISKTTMKDRLHNNLHENIGDIFNNLLPIYSSNTIKQEMNSIHKDELNLNKHYKSGILCSLKLKLVYALMYMIFFLVINGYSFYLFSAGKIKLDYLISILIVVLYLISLLSSAAGEIRDLMFNIGTLNETQKYLNLLLKNLPDTESIKNNKKIIINRGVIEFKNIDFKYPKSNKYVFRNFNLKIVPGESVAIIGQIGSGKTTLIKLLLKLNNYNSGKILIDNQEIRNFDEDLIRYYISYVPQNPKLFNRSVYDNMVYGINNIKHEDVTNLLKKFKVETMFNSLRDGLKTNVGKNGEKVSGGQRQIIFLIRCILRNNKIIILDEPTSSLDTHSREYIFNIVRELIKDKTFIVITHDLELLKIVHRVLEFKEGKIIKDTKN
jgi:ATP-binding cassette subfamily B protein